MSTSGEHNVNTRREEEMEFSISARCTGVCVGIYYEGMYMVKVILAEKRHFECPNEKVEENGLVTKSSNWSEMSLG